MDKHGEVDKGRADRNGRYSHDGDLVGIVGSGLSFFFHRPRPPFRSYLSFKPQPPPHSAELRLENTQQEYPGFVLQLSAGNQEEMM